MTRSVRCFTVALALAATSCTPKPEPQTAPKAAPAATDVARFMPLTHDTVYAYETRSEDTGEPGVLMLRVRRPRENTAELGAGKRVQRLDLGSDGIRHATGGYLLKSPLAVGSTWKGQFGQVRVTAVGRTIQVPAGKFTECIETVEQATLPVQKKVRTVFCPDVGIVLLEAEGMSNGDYTREQAVLRSFGPAIDLSLGAPP